MNQPPGTSNPWPSAPPAGAGGAGFTQLGEPPPEALQPNGGGYGAGPYAGAKVSATVADPGLGAPPPYGATQPANAFSAYGAAPQAPYGGGPGAYGAPSPYGSPYGVPPAAAQARAATSGGSGLGIVLGLLGVLAVGGGLTAFFLLRDRGGDEPPPPIEVPTPTPAASVPSEQPTATEEPAPADSPADTPVATPPTPQPVASTPAPKPTFTTPPKPTATTTTTTTPKPKPKPTATTTTPKPKPTSSGKKPIKRPGLFGNK